MLRIVILSLFTCLIFTASTNADEKQLLGKIEFPTSGLAEAHPHFIEGLLYMHNFEYAEAADAFKKAQELDKNFAMAYWGEALAYTHPLWFQQSRQTAVDCLNRLGRTPEARQEKAGTQREKDYLWTIELLYGTVDETKRLPKNDRDDAYREAMAALHAKYPDDDEATTLYGLSILGTSHEGRDYATYMQAAATLTKVWDKNRQHPGAAHYLIHSYDDPVHAPLGLPMARAYNDIAPAAAHAQHMVSHIFVALGMWDDMVKSNTRAIEVENKTAKRPGALGHYEHWLMYGNLQRGEMKKAAELMKFGLERIKDDPQGRERLYYGYMVGRYVIDTENWNTFKEWDYTDVDPKQTGARDYYFAKGYAAAMRGDLDEAKGLLATLKECKALFNRPNNPEMSAVLQKELSAVIALKEGDTDTAVKLMQEAADEEAAIPMNFGPPPVTKPARELLAETLLSLGRHEEAVVAFKTQFARSPRRTQVLEGLADASKALGKTAAEQGYRDTLKSIRHTAD
jgi:tetratricopeptide (TPR) repeat protein